MKNGTLSSLPLAVAGVLMGALARWLDLNTDNLGNLFSQLGIWILLGVLITVRSAGRRAAMFRVGLFCLGMLAGYYGWSALSGESLHWNMIVGWTLFALCSPILALFTWMARGRGPLAQLLRVGIVAAAILSSVVLFDGPRIYDLPIAIALVYLLYRPRRS